MVIFAEKLHTQQLQAAKCDRRQSQHGQHFLCLNIHFIASHLVIVSSRRISFLVLHFASRKSSDEHGQNKKKMVVPGTS